ncbi:MAG: hypothetical protein AB1898_33505 [Acidobacteriota bacterium]|jgi:hypothetical protein
MMTPLIEEDGLQFVLPCESSTPMGVPNHFGQIETEDAEMASNVTQELIGQVLREMRPKYRKEIAYLMEREHIDVYYEQERLNLATR